LVSTGRKRQYEEAENAAKIEELLGEVVTDSTKKNLEMQIEAEFRRMTAIRLRFSTECLLSL